MADRSSIYSEKERDAAIAALKSHPFNFVSTAGNAAEAVDLIADVFGMKRQGRTYRSLADAPHDRDIVLRTPKRGDVRTVWWANWADPADPLPWAWREARADGTVGPNIPEADGWRELPL